MATSGAASVSCSAPPVSVCVSAPRTAVQRPRRMTRCAGTRWPSRSTTEVSANSGRPRKRRTRRAPVRSLWCVPMDGLSSARPERALPTASNSGGASKRRAASPSAASSACADGAASSSGWR
eukprot:3346665-Prymnesium_polylepis.1